MGSIPAVELGNLFFEQFPLRTFLFFASLKLKFLVCRSELDAVIIDLTLVVL